MRHAIVALALLASAHAAELSGRIQYSPQVALDQAQLTLINEATGVRRVAVSNADGYYTILNAQPGVYKLIVRKEGFKSAVRMDIKLDIDELARIDITMQLGAMSETITVESDRSSLDPEDPSLKTVVRRDFLDNLPVSGRALLTLLEMAGGVVITPAGASYGAGQFSVNGQRSDANYVTVDGVSANAGITATFSLGAVARRSPGGALPPYTAIGSLHGLVSLEALEEFRIDTATTRTESGRMSGAQVSLSTRSGTNKFHGSAFEYFRHDALAANDWFANSSAQARPPLRFHDFGATLGGPVVSNRTFFFFSQETLRLRQSPSQLEIVPSAEVRSQAAPALRSLLAPLPSPAAVDPFLGTGSITEIIPRTSLVNATSIRMDHTVSSRLQVFGRYNHAPSSNLATEFGGTQVSRLNMPTDTLTAGADAAVSSTVQASVRVGYSAAAQEMAVTPQGTAAKSDLGFAAIAKIPAGDISYQMNPPNLTLQFANWNNRYSQRQWNLTGSLGATVGTHQMRWGADYRLISPQFETRPYVLYPYYLSLQSFLAARFLILFIYQYEPAAMRLHNLSLYAEDAWKVSGRLTLSYGLRLESNPPPVSPDRQPMFTAIAPGAPDVLRTSSDGADLWKNGYRHLAPRFGFALRPAPRSGLVLRSGIGMFYDVGFGSAVKASPLLVSARSIQNVPFEPDQYSETNLATLSAAQLIAADFRSPLTLRWNATLEQSFRERLVASLSYVGAAGSHLLRMQNTPGQHYIASDGTSRYHSLQAQARAQARGIQAMFSFGWSHSVDNASTEDDPTTGTTAPPTPYPAFPIGRGNSDFDVRLSTFAAVLYQPKKLRGWSIDGVFRARSGFPVDVTVANLVHPNLVGGQPVRISDSASATGWRLNPAAFAVPRSGEQGNVGRNVLFGPGMWQLDLAVQREFPLTRRTALQLRVETFNALNHPNFGNPYGMLSGGNPNFGVPWSMLNQFLGTGGPANGLTPALQIGGPRSTQVALRLRF